MQSSSSDWGWDLFGPGKFLLGFGIGLAQGGLDTAGATVGAVLDPVGTAEGLVYVGSSLSNSITSGHALDHIAIGWDYWWSSKGAATNTGDPFQDGVGASTVAWDVFNVGLTARAGVGAIRTGVNAVRGAGTAPSARLPQDVSVNPTAPRPLPLNRPVGLSATQNADAQARIADLRRLGATDLRVNQHQINVAGVRVGINRPDLQYTLRGIRYYEEFDRSTSTRGPNHMQRILLNDPIGRVILSTSN